MGWILRIRLNWIIQENLICLLLIIAEAKKSTVRDAVSGIKHLSLSRKVLYTQWKP